MSVTSVAGLHVHLGQKSRIQLHRTAPIYALPSASGVDEFDASLQTVPELSPGFTAFTTVSGRAPEGCTMTIGGHTSITRYRPAVVLLDIDQRIACQLDHIASPVAMEHHLGGLSTVWTSQPPAAARLGCETPS